MIRNRWLFTFLFLILGGLVSARMYTIVVHTDQANAEVPSSSESVCAGQGKSIDLLQYMRPSALDKGGAGQKYVVSGCRTVNGVAEAVSQPDVQVIAKTIDNTPSSPLSADLARTGFMNAQEWWFYDNNNVYLYEDKSANFQCADNSDTAFYREQNTIPSGPSWGGPYKRCVNNGDTVSDTHHFFSYKHSNESACSVDWDQTEPLAAALDMTNPVTFKVTKVVDNSGVVNPSYQGIAPEIPDTIVIEITGGPGKGEKRFYSRGYGLTGYYEEYSPGKITFHSRAKLTPTKPGEEEKCDGTDPLSQGRKLRKINTIFPTDGMPEALAAKDNKAMTLAMAKGGYAAVCVAQLDAGPQFENLDAYIKANEGKTKNVDNIKSQETLSAADATIPFVRDGYEDPNCNASVENYWSSIKCKGKDPYESALGGSPTQSKLSYAQQLQKQEDNLLIREKACSAYTATDCALWEPQPGAQYNLKETLTMLRSSGLRGTDLAQPYQQISGKTSLSAAGFDQLRKRMAEVPFNLERAVDLNYMVLVKELPKKENQVSFSFLVPAKEKAAGWQDPNATKPDGLKRDTVSAIAFTVPAFGTNTGDAYSVNWPQWMFQQSQQPEALNQADKATEQSRRDLVAQQAAAVAAIAYDSPQRNINPVGDAFFGAKGSYDTTTKALVDLADNAAASCVTPVAEDAQNLKTGVTYSKSDQYTTTAGPNLFSDIFGPSSGHGLFNPFAATTDYSSDVTIAKDGSKDHATIKMIWVTRYPVENTDPSQKLKNGFFTQSQLSQLTENEKDYHAAATAANGDQAQLAAITSDKKLLGDAVPYKNDAAFDKLYNWSTQQQSVPFQDPANCKTATDKDGKTITGKDGKPVQDCTNELKVGVDVKAKTVAAVDQSKSWNELTRIPTLTLWSFGSAQRDHTIASQNPEEYLRSDKRAKAAENAGSSSDILPTGVRPTSVATFNGVGKTITSGEHAVFICADTGRQCKESEIKPGSCTLYKPELYDISNWKSPTDDTIDCSKMGSYAARAYKNTLVANPVNDQGQFVSSSNLTACQYVVNQAKARGVSPRLALSVWGEESGFGSVGGAFFGYIPGKNDWDLAFQVNGFLTEVSNASTYEGFMLKYSDDTNGKFCTNPEWPGRVKDFYEYLDPGINPDVR